MAFFYSNNSVKYKNFFPLYIRHALPTKGHKKIIRGEKSYGGSILKCIDAWITFLFSLLFNINGSVKNVQMLQIFSWKYTFPACKNIKSTFYISYPSPMKRNLHMMDIDICYWCTVFLSNTSLMGRYRMTYSGIELHFIHIEAHICLENDIQHFAVDENFKRDRNGYI